jgi:Fuc2NAc and GlcNAc transferase
MMLLAAGGALAWLLTGAVRRYALARSLLDVPNHRSSHSVPTPRGGGVAIAAVAILGIVLTAGPGWIEPRLAVALLGGGVFIAGIGWVDDHRGMGARVRFMVHLIGALWAVAWLGGLPQLELGFARVPLGVIGFPLAVVGVVWFTNLYNFMDGIDGLAAGEALTVGIAGGLLLLGVGASGLALLSFLFAASSAGFLVWNWAPAKIFMGDVGSGLLGFIFAVLALASERNGAVPLLAWALLFGVFIFDATATLTRRFLRREPWYEAHRDHAYQRAVRAGWSHARVTKVVLGLNLILAGLALAAVLFPSLLTGAVGVGFLLLLFMYLSADRLFWPVRLMLKRGREAAMESEDTTTGLPTTA